jgi:hypothetical protein
MRLKPFYCDANPTFMAVEGPLRTEAKHLRASGHPSVLLSTTVDSKTRYFM